MYQKDFVLKMIEMMGEMLAAFFGLLKKRKIKEAIQVLENMYYDLLKNDAAYFQQINKNNLTDELIDKHNFTNDHLGVLAELFFAEAELRRTQDLKVDSIEFYEKSKMLFEYISNSSKTFSMERDEKVNKIISRLEELK